MTGNNAFLDKLRADLEKKKQEQEQLYKEVSEILAKLALNKAKCEELEHLITVTIPNKISDLEREKAFNLGKVAELDQKLVLLKEDLEKLVNEKTALEAKNEQVKTKISELEAEIAILEGEIDVLFLVDNNTTEEEKLSDEINKQLAIRDEIQIRLKKVEHELRNYRNNYSSVLVNLTDVQKGLANSERHVFKYKQAIDTIDAQYALEKCTIEQLQLAVQVNKEEISDLESIKKQTPDWDQYKKELNAKNEEFEKEKNRIKAEREKCEQEQLELDPKLHLFEDTEQDMMNSNFSAENSLLSNNNIFDSFFGSIYQFIITPGKFSAEQLFSKHSVSAANEKRTILRNQLDALQAGFKHNAAEISNLKKKQADIRDIINKQRTEIALYTFKAEKNRNLTFMMNKTSDQVQESIDDKNSIINEKNTLINEKIAENEQRKAVLNEEKEKLQRLEKDIELKKNEINNLRNNLDNIQENIINSVVLYEQVNYELNASYTPLAQRPEKSTKVQSQRHELATKIRSLQRQHREKIKENEALNLLITSFAEDIIDKKNEEKPLLNEKRLFLAVVADLEAKIQSEINERERCIQEKLNVEDDSRRLNEHLDHNREKIEINKLTIRAKEEIIELNQPFIPNINTNTTFY